MIVKENTTSWMTYSLGRNKTQVSIQFDTPDYIVTLYILYLSACMAIGLPGNSIVLAIFQKNKPKTNADWYIFYMAAFDLVCLSVNVPLYIAIQTKMWDIADVNALCKAQNFLGQFVTFSESCLICAIAIERFIKICRPKCSLSWNLQGRCIVYLIALSSVVICSPNVFFSWMGIQKSCVPYMKPSWIAPAFFLFTMGMFIIMFGIQTFCYTRVAFTLFQSGKHIAQHTIDSRRIVRRVTVSFLPSQTESIPGTSKTHTLLTGQTSSLTQKDVMCLHGYSSDPSYHHLEGTKASFSEIKSYHNKFKSNNQEQNVNCCYSHDHSKKNAMTLARMISPCIKGTPSIAKTELKINQLENVVPRTIKTLSTAQKMRLIRTTTMSFFISFIFIISWLPVLVYTIMAFSNTRMNMLAGLFTKQSYLLNTFMNPILYLVLNPYFRKKAKGLFCKDLS